MIIAVAVTDFSFLGVNFFVIACCEVARQITFSFSYFGTEAQLFISVFLTL